MMSPVRHPITASAAVQSTLADSTCQELVNVLPVGITVFDIAGSCIYKNATASSYFPGNHTSQNISSFTDSADRLRQVVASGGIYRYLHQASPECKLQGHAQRVCHDPTGEAVTLITHTELRSAESTATAREGQTREQLRTLQRKLLGVVAENDALRAVAVTVFEELSQVQDAAEHVDAVSILSDATTKQALVRLLYHHDDANNAEDLEVFDESPVVDDWHAAGTPLHEVSEADVQLLKLIQFKRAGAKRRGSAASEQCIDASLASSGESSEPKNITAMRVKLKALLEERDQARLQATAMKASCDHLLIKSAAQKGEMASLQDLYGNLAEGAAKLKLDYDFMEINQEQLNAVVAELQEACGGMADQKAELLAEAQEMQAKYSVQKAHHDKLAVDFEEANNLNEKLANDNVLQKTVFDKLAVEAASLKAGYDAMESEQQQLAAAAAGHKAMYDSQKAEFDTLATAATTQKADFDHQKSQYDKLIIDATDLKSGFDVLASNNVGLAAQAAHQKAMFDSQKEQYDQLHHDAAALKAGYDTLASENQKLSNDATEQKLQFDNQKLQYDRLQEDASELKATYDRLDESHVRLADDTQQQKRMYDAQKADYDKLQVDASELKSGYDLLADARTKLEVDAAEQKQMYDAQKADYAKLQVDATEQKQMYDAQKAGYDKLQVDASELKSGYDLLADARIKLEVDAAEQKQMFNAQKADYDRLQVDAMEMKSGYDSLSSVNEKLKEDAVNMKSGYDALHDSNSKLRTDATEFKAMYDVQKEEFDQLAGDASDMKAEFDSSMQQLKSAYDVQHQQYDKLQQDAGNMKAEFDSQKAQLDDLSLASAMQKVHYDKLTVDAAELKAGYDELASNNEKLSSDAAGMKSAFDNQQALVSKLQVDSAHLTAEKSKLENDVVGLQAHIGQVAGQLQAEQVNNAALQEQQEALLRKQQLLQAELELAMRNSRAIIDSGTPAEKILHMMTELMDGSIPNISDILFIQSAILESHNIYKPIRLQQQLMQSDRLEEDVSRALVAQLGDDSAAPAGIPAMVSLQELCNQKSGRRSASPTSGLAADAGNTSMPSAVSWIMHAGQLKGVGAATSSSQNGGAISLSLCPEPVLLRQVDEVLGTVHEWQFDAFSLADATQQHPLSVLGFYLFQESDLIIKFNLDKVALARFLCEVENGYKQNPYHNAIHAADVLQTMHALMHRGGLVPGYADHLTVMAGYIAAIVHDYEHGGYTNDFLIASAHDLSILYNDRAPLENHHVAAAFDILRKPEFNFLKSLSRADQTRLRKLVIEMVLSTDMKQHFTILSHFTTIHRLTAPGMSSPSSRSTDATRRLSSSLGYMSEAPEDKILLPLDDNERMLSLQVALKIADIGHLAAALPVHQRWVQKLEEEFFRQGDAEKSLDLPVSALFDREKPGITKSQVGFFDIVAVPLFHNYTRVFTGARPLFSNVLHNYNFWAGSLKEAAADPASS